MQKNTIAVVANGLDIKYPPSINSKLIESIEKDGLMLSSYEDGFKARNYTFVQRNEIVVSLGEILIVTQADEKSGTLTSINYALEMGKKSLYYSTSFRREFRYSKTCFRRFNRTNI